MDFALLREMPYQCTPVDRDVVARSFCLKTFAVLTEPLEREPSHADGSLAVAFVDPNIAGVVVQRTLELAITHAESPMPQVS